MRKDQGVTLMELMIVVAVIGILAAIAYPTYMSQVREGRRTDAQSMLLRVLQREERNYTRNNTYTKDLTDLDFSKGKDLPTENEFYLVNADTCDAKTSLDQCVSVTATPQGQQTADDCGSLTVNSRGQKSVSGAKTVAECW